MCFVVYVLQDGELLIRLKSIRAFLKLPILMENTMTAVPTPHYVNTTVDEEEEEEDCAIVESNRDDCAHAVLMQEKSCKMKILLNHHVQVMISYLNRELHQDSLSSINIVQSYVSSYCKELLQQMDRNN